jgi:hypothetical protein
MTMAGQLLRQPFHPSSRDDCIAHREDPPPYQGSARTRAGIGTAASCTASAWPSPTVYRGRRIESSQSAEPWIASKP